MDEQLGFRRLNVDNWLNPDPLFSKAFGFSQPESWAADVFYRQLNSNVPSDIVRMFEVGRTMVLYGYFFYPLLAAGNEQLYRVVDAATVAKCSDLSASPKHTRTYADRISWLGENGLILTDQRARWEAARALRNEASHPDFQTIYPPGMALSGIDVAAELIEQLFRTDALDG